MQFQHNFRFLQGVDSLFFHFNACFQSWVTSEDCSWKDRKKHVFKSVSKNLLTDFLFKIQQGKTICLPHLQWFQCGRAVPAQTYLLWQIRSILKPNFVVYICCLQFSLIWGTYFYQYRSQDLPLSVYKAQIWKNYWY